MGEFPLTEELQARSWQRHFRTVLLSVMRGERHSRPWFRILQHTMSLRQGAVEANPRPQQTIRSCCPCEDAQAFCCRGLRCCHRRCRCRCCCCMVKSCWERLVNFMLRVEHNKHIFFQNAIIISILVTLKRRFLGNAWCGCLLLLLLLLLLPLFLLFL